MAKQKHVTFGGLGQHEFYMPTTGKGHTNRRDRKKCEFYFEKTQYCSKIRNSCVGPTICKKYKAKKLTPSGTKKKKYDVGTVVYNESRGEGKIVTISQDICTIQFISGQKVTAKYPDVFKKGIFTTKSPK